MTSKSKLIMDVSYRLLTALCILIGLLIALFLLLFYTNKLVTLPIVLIFGSIGAFISLQRRLKQLDDEDLILIKDSKAYTWLAPIAGGVMAGILYLLFISGLLSGDLFPKFKVNETLAKDVEGIVRLFYIQSNEASDYAKLLFWSFVAGFSERFVTDIIGQFAADAKKVA